MRSLFIICIVASIIPGCTKKATPTTTIDTRTTTETKAVTEIKSVVTAVESDMSKAGHITFDAKCGRCHGLKKPGDFTVEQWMPILSDMAVRAKLDSTEKANVRAYVTFYARPSN